MHREIVIVVELELATGHAFFSREEVNTKLISVG